MPIVNSIHNAFDCQPIISWSLKFGFSIILKTIKRLTKMLLHKRKYMNLLMVGIGTYFIAVTKDSYVCLQQFF